MTKRIAVTRRERVAVSAEQRQHLIDDAAFFRAEKRRIKRGTVGDRERCRSEAEAAINAVLGRKRSN